MNRHLRGMLVCAITFLSVGLSAAQAAGPGQYSSPEAWPLRGSNLVGCAKDSPGPICGGTYHPNWAIDVEAPEGQEIYASGSGLAKVFTNTTACTNYGRSVVVEHGANVKSLYGHMSRFSADVAANPAGVWVDENTVIGYVGHTGNVSNCSYNHLHYEETTNGSLNTSATDPGPLRACVGGSLRSYPDYWHQPSWEGLPGHTFTATSDGPSCAPVLPPKPSCAGAAVTVAHDAATAVTLSCSGESITYSPPSPPEHGTITNFDDRAGTLTYTPTAGYSGPDRFTFAATNAGGSSETATITLVVLPAKPTCAPIATLVTTGTPAAIQLTCSGQAMSYTTPSAPAHGTISAFDATTGTLIYAPAPGYTGPDSFAFAASNAGGAADAAVVDITISTPPAISGLRANASCIRTVRLNGTPVRGRSGLSFSYTLNQPAQVLYQLFRRDNSTRHKHCPKHPTGHTQDTFTSLGDLTGPGAAGTNDVVLGRSARRAAPRLPQLRKTLRAGRHRIKLARIANERVLAPGTYILLVSATNSLGQRSDASHAKFFALGDRAPTYVRDARSR